MSRFECWTDRVLLRLLADEGRQGRWKAAVRIVVMVVGEGDGGS